MNFRPLLFYGLALALGAMAPGCGRRQPRRNPRAFANEVASWMVEEAAKILPPGARVVIWAADPPPTITRPATRLGDACARAARAAGFDVRIEQGEWPEAPLLDEAALQELQRRHAPLDAVFAVAAGVFFEDSTPAAAQRPRVLVLATRPDPRLEQWVQTGHIALALMPADHTAGRSVRDSYRLYTQENSSR
jgi:hypothetical protein